MVVERRRRLQIPAQGSALGKRALVNHPNSERVPGWKSKFSKKYGIEYNEHYVWNRRWRTLSEFGDCLLSC